MHFYFFHNCYFTVMCKTVCHHAGHVCLFIKLYSYILIISGHKIQKSNQIKCRPIHENYLVRDFIFKYVHTAQVVKTKCEIVQLQSRALITVFLWNVIDQQQTLENAPAGNRTSACGSEHQYAFPLIHAEHSQYL